MQPVVVRAGAQVCKALPDSGILHAGNPQAAYGLGAACQAVDRAEDQLPLAPGIAGVDHLGHIFPPQQGTQHIKLVPLILGDGEPPGLRQDGQIVVAPLGIVRVVGGGIRQPGQMPQAPAHQPAVAFQITVPAVRGPQHGSQRFCNRGFLRDHQSILCHGFFLLSRSHAVSCRWQNPTQGCP